jgi:hypothetical protein
MELHSYEGVLERLVRQLEIEKIKFENTCVLLLEGMLPVDRVVALVEDDLEGWKDPEFQDALKRYLRTNAAAAFTKAVATLNVFLQGLVKEIGLHENRQVCQVHYTTPSSSQVVASEN